MPMVLEHERRDKVQERSSVLPEEELASKEQQVLTDAVIFFPYIELQVQERVVIPSPQVELQV